MSDQNAPRGMGLAFHFLPKDDDQAALVALRSEQPSDAVDNATKQDAP